MTLLADAPVAWVTLDLDTTPPSLTLVVEDRVEPPDGLPMRIVANEPVGVIRLVLTDAAGAEHRIGSMLVDDRTIAAVLPTLELASGPATLTVTVRDQACNPTTLTRRIDVLRRRTYDVLAWTENAYEVTKPMSTPHDVTAENDPAYDTTVTGDTEYAVEVGNETAYDVTAETETD